MKTLKIGKKAMISLQDMGTIAVSFVATAIIIGIGATILTSIQSGQTSNGAAYNASGYGLSSLSTMAQYLPTIAIVVVAAIVISVLAFLYYARQE